MAQVQVAAHAGILWWRWFASVQRNPIPALTCLVRAWQLRQMARNRGSHLPTEPKDTSSLASCYLPVSILVTPPPLRCALNAPLSGPPPSRAKLTSPGGDSCSAI